MCSGEELLILVSTHVCFAWWRTENTDSCLASLAPIQKMPCTGNANRDVPEQWHNGFVWLHRLMSTIYTPGRQDLK